MLESNQVFSCEICEIFKNAYFEEHLRSWFNKAKKTAMIFEKLTGKHLCPNLLFYLKDIPAQNLGNFFWTVCQ